MVSIPVAFRDLEVPERASDRLRAVSTTLATRACRIMPRVTVSERMQRGDAVKEGEDFYGQHVVMVSRVTSQASGGEVLVSDLLRQLVEPSGEFAFESREPVMAEGARRRTRAACGGVGVMEPSRIRYTRSSDGLRISGR